MTKYQNCYFFKFFENRFISSTFEKNVKEKFTYTSQHLSLTIFCICFLPFSTLFQVCLQRYFHHTHAHINFNMYGTGLYLPESL